MYSTRYFYTTDVKCCSNLWTWMIQIWIVELWNKPACPVLLPLWLRCWFSSWGLSWCGICTEKEFSLLKCLDGITCIFLLRWETLNDTILGQIQSQTGSDSYCEGSVIKHQVQADAGLKRLGQYTVETLSVNSESPGSGAVVVTVEYQDLRKAAGVLKKWIVLVLEMWMAATKWYGRPTARMRVYTHTRTYAFVDDIANCTFHFGSHNHDVSPSLVAGCTVDPPDQRPFLSVLLVFPGIRRIKWGDYFVFFLFSC